MTEQQKELMKAIEEGVNFDLIEFLINKLTDNGTNAKALNFTDDEGNTILHKQLYAEYQDMPIELQQDNDKKIWDKILSILPELRYAQNREGFTPLHIAAIAQKEHALEYLIKDESQVDKFNIRDKQNKTFASYLKGDTRTYVQLMFIDKTFDAIEKDDLQTVIKLLNFGVDINTRIHCYENVSFLEKAISRDRTEIAIALLNRGATNCIQDVVDRDMLIYASVRGNQKVVRALLEQGKADINYKDVLGRTALIYAAINNRQVVVEELLNYKGKESIDINATDMDGWTSLMLAAYEGNIAIVQKLLDEGARIDITNKEGKTALQLAKTDEVRQMISNHINERQRNQAEMGRGME